MNLKAAIYSRKSKFTGKGESIDNQIQMCKEYALSQFKGKTIDEFFIYEDEGFSGGNTNRPQFQKLLEDVKHKKFDVLICYRLDRISRNVADFSTTLDILQKYDVDFVSIREQFDTSSPMGRAMIYIASVFAQLERETIAERVRDNMLELAKTGRWLGGNAPLGYEAKRIKYLDESLQEHTMTKLKPTPSELELVKLIYDKYLELGSLGKVTAYLLENHYKSKNGTDFDITKLKFILTNPVYVKADENVFAYLEKQGITTCGEPDGEHGLLTYNKQKSSTTDTGKVAKVIRDKSEWIAALSSHSGIIDSKDWLLVQKFLEKNKDTFPYGYTTHNALLTGILKCALCGSPMRVSHGRPSKKTGEMAYYYACSMKKNSKGTRCDNKNVRVDNLDKVVINSLKKLGEDKRALIEKIQKKIAQKKKASREADAELNIKNTITDKNRQIDILLNKISTNDDLADLFIGKIKVLKSEITNLEDQLKNLNNNKKDEFENEISLSFVKMLLEKCSIIDTLNNDEKKQLIQGLGETITWNGETHEFILEFIGSTDSKKK